jgi:crotonobetainyl-CoA:carnitine CoA-transferase CaiB-like acyl-CoA transferase
VFSEDEWRALKRLMGSPAWAEAPEFAAMRARHANRAALDQKLAGWTTLQEPTGLTDRLQQAGVCGALVQNAEDLNEHDPQLAARGVFFEMDHPVIGPARFEGSPTLFSRTKQVNWRSGPLLGEDNHYVLTAILGMSNAEAEVLADEGVV